MHQQISSYLNEATIQIVDSYLAWFDANISYSQCPYNGKMTRYAFCAGGKDSDWKDSCQGDSGSPLMCYDDSGKGKDI